MKLQNTQSLFVAFILTACCAVNAQVPQRLQIPGAVPLPASRSSLPARVRRPVAVRAQSNLLPSNIPSRIEEAKPVTESGEDEAPDVYLPQLLREQQLAQAQQSQFQQAAAAFLNNEQNAIPESVFDVDPFTTRFPDRTLPPPTLPPSQKPNFNDFGIGSNIINSPRFSQERPAPPPPPQQAPLPQRERTNVIRNRPTAVREPRPQFDVHPAPVPQRPRAKPIQSRPLYDQNQIDDREPQQQNRRQRPVAQTTRKWREENEDGTIVWGYENDDGSFKEEVIGVDCITKGTYGYIDPDGNKREYHYETGIKCDPNKRGEADEYPDNGFVNYDDNKAVLPNGIEIDMAQLGKKKSKRPGVNYRN
ncbi:bromodomain-containing protein 4 [Stomoxys calcitrans]|uniref:bromodomain-containing protein 4 n=1 Tax=Stomoxys calcitrans TaxID=35570 RepID=UPI0027E2B67A|nr:bromodomain-containing protein 4 [Stomoxys calcitrans]